MSAKKRHQNVSDKYCYNDPPQHLCSTNFFGIIPDEEQQKLVDSVWKKEKKMYLVDSIAGSGKTLMSTALGVLMVKYGMFDRVVYIAFPGINEKTQGYLAGDLAKKSEPYFQPLYDALIQINEDPNRVCNISQSSEEFGDVLVECMVSTYMRGINIHNSFVIVDEAENADLHTLAKVVSRISDDCIVMVIGHSGQCDMCDKSKSGFTAFIDYQMKYHSDICGSFSLVHNHRGWISAFADLVLMEYEEPQYGFIYMTTNKVNGKLYIGKHKRTMNPKDIDDSWYLGSGSLLRKAINKYGEDSFERTILYECDSPQKLNYMERVFIDYYNAVGDEKFYNLTFGGDGIGDKLSEEMRDRMRHPHKPMSEEARKHMARSVSEETRKKLSDIAKERLTGYVHSEQSKENMRQGHIGSKCMYKDGVYKNIRPENVEEYLRDGWVFKGSMSGKVFVNKDGKRIMINKDELDDYISEGWAKGRNINDLSVGGRCNDNPC